MFLAQQEEIQSLKTALAATASTTTTPTTVSTNDSNSIVSQLTTVMKQQNEALEKKMLNKFKTGGRQRKRRVKSDGKFGVKKEVKYYDKSNTTCYSCGYDVSDGHDSVSCKFKCEGHDDTHTGDNPVKGHNPKDMEFSKWKDNPKNKRLAGKKEDFE